MEQMIPVTIDGVQVEVPAGSTVLEAAHKANVKIPTLCFLKDINETANCRICVVDCGGRTLQAACVLPVTRWAWGGSCCSVRVCCACPPVLPAA